MSEKCIPLEVVRQKIANYTPLTRIRELLRHIEPVKLSMFPKTEVSNNPLAPIIKERISEENFLYFGGEDFHNSHEKGKVAVAMRIPQGNLYLAMRTAVDEKDNNKGHLPQDSIGVKLLADGTALVIIADGTTYNNGPEKNLASGKMSLATVYELLKTVTQVTDVIDIVEHLAGDPKITQYHPGMTTIEIMAIGPERTGRTYPVIYFVLAPAADQGIKVFMSIKERSILKGFTIAESVKGYFPQTSKITPTVTEAKSGTRATLTSDGMRKTKETKFIDRLSASLHYRKNNSPDDLFQLFPDDVIDDMTFAFVDLK